MFPPIWWLAYFSVWSFFMNAAAVAELEPEMRYYERGLAIGKDGFSPDELYCLILSPLAPPWLGWDRRLPLRLSDIGLRPIILLGPSNTESPPWMFPWLVRVRTPALPPDISKWLGSYFPTDGSAALKLYRGLIAIVPWDYVSPKEVINLPEKAPEFGLFMKSVETLVLVNPLELYRFINFLFHYISPLPYSGIHTGGFFYFSALFKAFCPLFDLGCWG